MSLASHIIWSTYGFWLPNDERGSWSTQVRADHLKRFGPATKVETTQSIAHRGYDRSRRREMRATLKYPPVRLTGVQARATARGFGQVVGDLGLVVYACAVMPDHVHLVVVKHAVQPDAIARRFKSAASMQMTREGVRPLLKCRDRHGRVPTPWASGGWCVYLDTRERVRQCIGYVDRNPKNHGLRAQRWGFVTGYE